MEKRNKKKTSWTQAELDGRRKESKKTWNFQCLFEWISQEQQQQQIIKNENKNESKEKIKKIKIDL